MRPAKPIYEFIDDRTVDRFHSKVAFAEGGCWEWVGAIQPNGYGYFGLRHGNNVYSHRFSWTLAAGRDVPQGLSIDHKCRNRRCVNPTHLEPVTTRENLLRGETTTAKNAARAACPRGHEYTPGNTYQYRGSRYCKTCWNSSRGGGPNLTPSGS